MLPLYSAVLSSDGLFADLIDLRGLYGAGRLRLTVDRGSVRLSAGAAPDALDVIGDYSVGVFEVSIPLTRLVKVERLTGNSSTILVEILPHTADERNVTATLSGWGSRFSKSYSDAIKFSADLAVSPRGKIIDDDYAAWSVVAAKDAQSVISKSPLPGFSMRMTTSAVSASYITAKRAITPLTLDTAGDLLNIRFNVPNGNNCRNIKVVLMVDAAGVNKATIAPGFNWHSGINTASMRIADFTFAGSATASSVYNYVRIDLTTEAFANCPVEIDVGEAWVGGKSRVPLVVIGCDGGNEKCYSWLWPLAKAHGFPVNIFAWTPAVGTAGKMTLDNYKEMYAGGCDHGLYFGNYGANSHNLAGVAVSQSIGAGGTAIINGTYASAGVATLDAPRIVTICPSTGSEVTNTFTIVGTDSTGNAITETLVGTAYPLKVYSLNEYKTVSSVTALNATANPVSVGTAFTRAELIAAFNAQKPWLDAQGFTRGALNFALPLGEHNKLTEGWLREVGFKTARTTHIAVSAMREQSHGVPINPYFLSCAVTMGDPGSDAVVMGGVQKAIDRGLDITILAHLGGVTPDLAELQTTCAKLGAMHRAGTIRIVSFSEYEQALGL